MSIEQPQAIIVFGRGVGQDSHGRWKPTRLFEEMKVTKRPDGTDELQHSGKIDLCPDPEKPNTLFGGANANALATFHLYQKLVKEGIPPEIIFFAAGIPKYLKDAPEGTSEGSVLKDIVFRLLASRNLPLPDFRIQTKNRNTRDDMDESLIELSRRSLSRAVIITVQVHTERTQAFLEHSKVLGEEKDAFSLEVVSSEGILAAVDPRLERIFKMVHNSAPYKRTKLNEKKGIGDLQSGRYRFS